MARTQEETDRIYNELVNKSPFRVLTVVKEDRYLAEHKYGYYHKEQQP